VAVAVRLASPMASSWPQPMYQLKVTLLGSEPKIWRRFCVPATIRLSQLHKVLQRVLGWTDSHLHAFHHGDDIYQIPYPGFDDLNLPGERCCQDERKFTLVSLLERPRQKLHYEYDMGDGWEHEIVLEKILPGAPAQHPVCLAGENACPPEDCGGIGGYYQLLETLDDPKHPEHAHLLEWLAGPFDPKAFDLTRVNRTIKTIKP
jgi:hypothetical protein